MFTSNSCASMCWELHPNWDLKVPKSSVCDTMYTFELIEFFDIFQEAVI